ncbi:MAG: prepilin peptidase [Prosthecobacter sp.]|uniref:prepilin peptidase n=1 Tax=Prosthecobacter sp. TaxID=1965333 RepID=UPI0038FD9F16
MIRFQILDTLLHFLAFYIGAGIGSFLNVVIYRLPLGISVNNPKRSFCPSCKHQIPMWQNIPLLSWLLLRGKCASCGGKISVRYFMVELLTGVMFYLVFLKISGEYPNPWPEIQTWGPQVLCLWVFMSLLISGTFIDIDHFILPHSITIGGAVVGVLASWWVPALVDQHTHTHGLLISLASAALGLGGLWLVVELGKLAFGRKKFVFEKVESWEVKQPDENEPPVVVFGEHNYGWADLFMRATDRMVVSCNELQVNDRSFGAVTAELWMEKLKVRDGASLEEFSLEGVTTLKAKVTQVVIPREAMGFGDVLFLMMIGAFTGWQAVLFTILAASVLGTVFAVIHRVTGKAEWGAKIPFGPYLAMGAVIWVFYGPQFVEWYVSKTMWR